METTPVLLSWSGGKDSMMSLLALREDPAVEVAGLLTSVTSGYERVSVHGVRRELLDAQAAALGLPVVEIHLAPESSNAAYEEAFAAAVAAPLARGVRTVAFGDLFLADVRAYREALLDRLGLDGLYPVWGRDTAAFARDVVARGVRAVLCAVDTGRLDAAFAGRDYDEALLEELPEEVDPAGERGEFHTFVWDGPGFAAPVAIRRGKVEDRPPMRYTDLLAG
ncbi:MAG TPA: hypothetical protein VNU01_05845 [Egibacteraceae bacterium]|nr:hypothetical protein [Egibacteraceae bacterium]